MRPRRKRDHPTVGSSVDEIRSSVFPNPISTRFGESDFPRFSRKRKRGKSPAAATKPKPPVPKYAAPRNDLSKSRRLWNPTPVLKLTNTARYEGYMPDTSAYEKLFLFKNGERILIWTNQGDRPLPYRPVRTPLPNW